MNRYFSIYFAVLLSASNQLQADELLGQDSMFDAQLVSGSADQEEIAVKLLTPQERTVLSMLASVMDIVTARINTSRCYNYKGHYDLSLYATGAEGQRRQNNMVRVDFKTHPISVMAHLRQEAPDLGAKIYTVYGQTEILGSATAYSYEPVLSYLAEYGFNYNGEIQTSRAYLDLQNVSLEKESYRPGSITNLQTNENNNLSGEYAKVVNGWGSSWLLKEGYKIQKYWQRYKSNIDSESEAQTFLVRDLMDQNMVCRIQINLYGHNYLDYASQAGYLTISEVPQNFPLAVSFD